MTGSRLIVLTLTFIFSGCAEQQYTTESKTVSLHDSTVGRAPRAAAAAYERGNLESPAEAPQSPPAPGVEGPVPKSVPRKIIYTADVSIVVENFPKTTDAITALVSEFKGYIADTDITGSTGSNRRATWKVRVPVERFDSFLDAVSKLGELQRRQIHSQDITEEFFDLEARIKNKKVEEARLVQLLTEATGKLEEILNVERELSRVREEIERMEGRVRLLANLSDLTTVTIVAEERIRYIPETNPAFVTRIARTFDSSSRGLMAFLEGVVLMIVAFIPWLPLWILAGLILWFILRRIRRRFSNLISLKSRPNPA